jgi:hypothetical protein
MNTLHLLKDETEESAKILAELSTSYNGVNFELYRSNDAARFITCFVAAFPSTADCMQYWENINASIAVISQRYLRGEAAPWNLYLLISTPEGLVRDIKYKIENDRYASRKITVSHHELPDNTTEPYFTLLENIIFARDLTLIESQLLDSSKDVASSEAPEAEQIRTNTIKKFISAKDGLIPQDRKPSSVELRKQYVREMISLAITS